MKFINSLNKMNINMDNLKLSFSDVREIIKKYKHRIFYTSLIFGLIGGFYFLLKTPEYYAEATFKEKSKSLVETSKSLSMALILGGGEKNENSFMSVIKSRTILQPVISDLGLQAELSEPEGFAFLLRYLKNNVLTELSYWRPNFYPELTEKRVPTIENVQYNANSPLKLFIQFTSDNEYKIFDASNQDLGRGFLDQIFEANSFLFTITNPTSQSLNRTQWNLTLMPLTRTLDLVKSKMKVIPDLNDKSLLCLSYKDKNSQKASNFLNAVMWKYVDYLKDEHIRLANEQLSYLRRRQNEIANDLKSVMEEHAKALSCNTSSIEGLAQLQESYTHRSLLIDLELKRLNNAFELGVVYYDQYPHGTDSSVINQLLKDLRCCKEQSDGIQLAMNPLPPSENSSPTAPEPLNKINRYALDLDTAKELYDEYSKNLNEIEVNILHNQFILTEIEDPNFDLSSLSSVLNDVASQNIIHKSMEMDLHKLDQTNRSQKEIDRINEDLSLQRKYLLLHVKQVMQLLKIKQELLYKKIQTLQFSRLELINQRISVLNQHLSEYIGSRMQNFLQEKITLEKQQKHIKTQMEEMPNKWASEKLMDLHLEMSGKMVEEITKLVESKNISSHIDTTQSSPLDISTPSPLPMHPHILLFSLLAAFLGGMVSLSFVVARGILKEMPYTLNLLKQVGLPVLGQISNFDNDVIYRIIGWLNKSDKGSHKTLLLMINNCLNYSHSLALDMSKRGSKILMVSLEQRQMNSQVLPSFSDEFLITSQGGYDCLSILTASASEAVALFTGSFKNFLDKQTKKYDWVLVISNIAPCSNEGENLLEFCDYSIITLRKETMQQIIASFHLCPKKYLSILIE